MKADDHPAALRTLTTINAPLPRAIDAPTLLACLKLEDRRPAWAAHLRSFFADIDPAFIMDMVIEGSVNFAELETAARFWQAEENSNVEWIREMASLQVGWSSAGDLDGDRYDFP